MGSWNGTCMISKLPIISSEKIKLVILQVGYEPSVINRSAYVYSTDVLKPCFIQLNGEYNDYGGIEDIVEDNNFKCITAILKSKYKSIEVEKKKIKKYTIYDFLEGIERGSLRLSVDGKTYTNNDRYSTVMIREDVWDEAVRIQKEDKSYWKADKYRKTKEDYYWTGDECYDNDFKEAKEKNSGYEAYAKISQELADTMLGLQSIFRVKYSSSLSVLDPTIYEKHNIEDSLVEPFKQLNLVSDFVSHTRTGWMIQAGAGSQSDCWNSYLQMSKKIQEICEFKIKEYNEDYE